MTKLKKRHLTNLTMALLDEHISYDDYITHSGREMNEKDTSSKKRNETIEVLRSTKKGKRSADVEVESSKPKKLPKKSTEQVQTVKPIITQSQNTPTKKDPNSKTIAKMLLPHDVCFNYAVGEP